MFSSRIFFLTVTIYILTLFDVVWPNRDFMSVKAANPDSALSECISCHNGLQGKHKSFCLLSQKGKCSRHIITISFQEKSIKNKGLRPGNNIRPNKVVRESAINCSICHGEGPHEGDNISPHKRIFSICRSCHSR